MTPAEVLTATADVTQCSANGIAGRAKSGMVVHCRRVYAVACKLLGFGCRDTATTIGRDHSTICYLWKAATDADGQLARQVVRKVLNETRATPRAMAMKPRYGVAVSPGCMDDPAWRDLKKRANKVFHLRLQQQEAEECVTLSPTSGQTAAISAKATTASGGQSATRKRRATSRRVARPSAA